MHRLRRELVGVALFLGLGHLEAEVGGQRLLDHGQRGVGDRPGDRVHDQQDAVETHYGPVSTAPAERCALGVSGRRSRAGARDLVALGDHRVPALAFSVHDVDPPAAIEAGPAERSYAGRPPRPPFGRRLRPGRRRPARAGPRTTSPGPCPSHRFVDHADELVRERGREPASAWPNPSPSNRRLGSPAASNSRWACDGGNNLSSEPWTMITGVGAILPITSSGDSGSSQCSGMRTPKARSAARPAAGRSSCACCDGAWGGHRRANPSTPRRDPDHRVDAADQRAVPVVAIPPMEVPTVMMRSCPSARPSVDGHDAVISRPPNRRRRCSRRVRACPWRRPRTTV